MTNNMTPDQVCDEALGLFEISVSRNALVVHNAECSTDGEIDLLSFAIKVAKAAQQSLRGLLAGSPSLFSSSPKEVS